MSVTSVLSISHLFIVLSNRQSTSIRKAMTERDPFSINKCFKRSLSAAFWIHYKPN